MKHTFRKCLSLVLALATLLSVCVVPLAAVNEDECNHYNYDYTEIGHQDPTCSEYGGLLVVCNECGKRYVRRETWEDPYDHVNPDPNGETWKVEIERVDATLTEDGYVKYECKNCKETWTDVLKATKCEGGCAAENMELVSNTATCTTAGVKTEKCKRCGLEKTTDVPALGHLWNNGEVITRPVCGVANGVVRFTCTRTGCGATSDVEEVAAANHEWEWKAANEGSCGNNGNGAGYKCAQCDTWSKDGINACESLVIVKPQHHFVVCTDNVKADGTANPDHVHEGTPFNGCNTGVVYLKCTNEGCNYHKAENRVSTEEYEIGQTGNHILKKVNGNTVKSDCLVKVADPNCTEAKKYSCSLCGYTFASTLPEDAPAHDWAADVEATCDSFGYRSCKRCGATVGYADENGVPISGNERFNKKNHLPNDYNGKYPTTEAGWEILMNHVGGTKHAATCEKAAYYEWNCPHGCGTVTYYVGTNLPHQLVTVNHVDATCVRTGVVGGTYCSRCDFNGLTTDGNGNEITLKKKADAEAIIAELGHTWEAAGFDKDSHDFVVSYEEYLALSAAEKANISYWNWVEANCVSAKRKAVLCGRCAVEMRGSAIEYDENSPMTGKHTYIEGECESVYTPATCTKDALRRYYCYYCNTEAEINYNGTKLGHTWENDATIQPVIYVPATCTNDGYAVYFCTRCETMSKGDKVALVEKDHDRFVTHFTFTGNLEDDVAAVFDFSIQAWVFTLTPQGHDAIKADEFANVSLTWNSATKTYAVKFLNGKRLEDVMREADDTVGFKTADQPGYDPVENLGDCGIASYYEWKCNHCKYEYNKLIEDQYGPTGQHVAKNADIEMDCATGTPGTIGATICARCEAKMSAGVEVPVKHKIVTSLGSQTATCLNPGWTQYGVCTVCTAYYLAHDKSTDGMHVSDTDPLVIIDNQVYRYNGYKKALGHEIGVLIPARAATCLKDGWDAYYKCVRCDYVFDNDKIETGDDGVKTYPATGWVTYDYMTANYLNGYTDPLGHDFSGEGTLVPMKCNKDGWTWYLCQRDGCCAISLKGTYLFGFKGHGNPEEHFTDVACEESYWICCNPVQNDDGERVKCGEKIVVREASAHTNAAGEEILGINDCSKWVKDQDHKCKFCDKNFTLSEIKHGDPKSVHYTANCLDPKDYNSWSCTVCKQLWITDVVESNKTKDELHVWDGSIERVNPTWTTDGYRVPKCGLCGATGEKEIIAAPDLFFKMDIKNLYGGTTYVNGSYLTATIKVTGSKTDVHSFKLSIPFDTKALAFVGAQSTTVTVNGVSMIVEANDDNGVVELFIHVENAKDGVLQNVTITDEVDLVTLVFQVNPEFYDMDTKNEVNNVTSLDFDADATSILVYKNNAPVAVTYLAYDTKVEADYLPKTSGSAYMLTVYKLGDMNTNGYVTDADAVFVEAVVFGKTEVFDARADVNKDGVIDMLDFVAMKQYIVRILNYKEMAAIDATTAR